MAVISQQTKTTDPWLVGIWSATAILVPTTLAVFLAGLPQLYSHMQTTCPAVCEDNRLTAAAAGQWEAAGFSMAHYAIFYISLSVALAALCFGLAAVLLWRRPGDRMAVLTALLFVLLGGTYPNADELIGQFSPTMLLITELTNQIGFGLFPVLLLTLPDGRFVPGWSRWIAAGVLLVSISGISAFNIPFPDWVFWILMPFWAFSGPAAQIYRYRHIQDPNQKQQIKWVAAGISVGVVGFMVTVFIGVASGVDHGAGLWITLGSILALHLFMAIVPLAIGIGVLRYRLWDIDVLIRRTLLYAVLSGLLVIIYSGSVIIFQMIFNGISGRQSPLVIVASTLLIAALFNPLRLRLQIVLDRRFFRQKYDARLVLNRFAQTARGEVSLEGLQADLAAVIRETIQPQVVDVVLVMKKNV